MNRILLISIFVLLITSCTSNTIVKKPENLIPKDQMVELITEMMIASGGENIRNLQGNRNENYFPLIYEKYHIDSNRFKNSNTYYTSRIDDYEEILNKVQERLDVMRKKYEEERFRNDSLIPPEERQRPEIN